MPAGGDSSAGPAAVLAASVARTLGGSARLASATPVTRAVGVHPGVWRLRLTDGTRLVARFQPMAALLRGRPHDPLVVEPEVCRLLSDCPVAAVRGVDAERCVIYYAWCGEETIDDICQQLDPSVGRRFVRRAIEGFSLVRAGFSRHTRDLAPRAFPGCDAQALRSGWREACAGLRRDLPAACRTWGLSDAVLRRLSAVVRNLAEDLGRAEPSLGPTDYNARNVVVDRARDTVRFIEMGKVGWDWDERRLVQYTTAMGGGLPDGRFVSLVTSEEAAMAFGSREEVRRLDGHHALFHLIAACRLCRTMSAEGPDDEAPRALLRFWRGPKRRLAQLRRILAEPLSDDVAVGELRRAFEAKK